MYVAMKYQVPCMVCGKPVTVDQPTNSQIPVEEAYCLTCWKRIKSNDYSIFEAIAKRLRERGVALPTTYKEDSLWG
jgi:hypothetical protein